MRRSFAATSLSYPIWHRKLLCHKRFPLDILCSHSLKAGMPCRITCHLVGMVVWKHSRLPVPAWIHSCVLFVKRNFVGAPLINGAGSRGTTPSASSPRGKSQFLAGNAVGLASTGSWQGYYQQRANRSGSTGSSIVETRTFRWIWTWSSPRTLHGGSLWAMGAG